MARKVVCYFSADDRGALGSTCSRELSHELHERIDMRQIGVRKKPRLLVATVTVDRALL